MTEELELFDHDVSVFFFFIRYRKKSRKERGGVILCVSMSMCMCVCVLVFLSSALLFSPGWFPHHHRGMWLPWQHHVGSTRSVQPLFLLFLSANWLTPPNNVFKAVFFFFFYCLMFVLCPCGSCCCEYAFKTLLSSFFFFTNILWVVSSAPGARLALSLGLSPRQVCVLSFVVRLGCRWDRCHSYSVKVEKLRDDRNVKKHVFVWSARVCLSVSAVLWATCVCIGDAEPPQIVGE